MIRKSFCLFVSLLAFSVGSAFAGKLNQLYSGIPAYEGKVASLDRNGNVFTDIPNLDLIEAGYLLGDTVNIYFNNGFYLENIPLLDGEYVQMGEAYLLAAKSAKDVTLAIRGARVSTAGDLRVGDTFFLNVNTQKGAFDIEFLRTIAPSNNRLDYESDEVFANFRQVSSGHIAPNKIYRSSSPIDNTFGRALYADNLIRKANVKSVLNLADTVDNIRHRIASKGYRSNYYKGLVNEGSVIGLSMTSEFNTERFAKDITQGIACIVRHRMQPPILIHSTEGKSKTGYVCALLETLMGATYEEIVNDYMLSYSNYYSAKSASKMAYNLVVDKSINDMLFTICKVKNVEGLRRVDMSKAAREYLEGHGMTGREIDELMSLLSSNV